MKLPIILVFLTAVLSSVAALDTQNVSQKGINSFNQRFNTELALPVENEKFEELLNQELEAGYYKMCPDCMLKLIPQPELADFNTKFSTAYRVNGITDLKKKRLEYFIAYSDGKKIVYIEQHFSYLSYF